jgi:hypothetical protein
MSSQQTFSHYTFDPIRAQNYVSANPLTLACLVAALDTNTVIFKVDIEDGGAEVERNVS